MIGINGISKNNAVVIIEYYILLRVVGATVIVYLKTNRKFIVIEKFFDFIKIILEHNNE